MITFKVQENNGTVRDIEVPEEISLSMMEVLRASDYPIAATCGGMALCATCHIQILEGGERLGDLNDAELDMLDTLPNATSQSRLACQIRIDERVNGVRVGINESMS